MPKRSRRSRSEDGGDIVKHGTGELDRALVENQLVDEFHFWVFPVVVGKGDRLFDGLDLTSLKLVDTSRFESGIVVLVLLAPLRDYSRFSWIILGESWMQMMSRRSGPRLLNLCGVSVETDSTVMSPGPASSSSPSAVNDARPPRTIQVSE